MDAKFDYFFSLLLVGDSFVGKSSLQLRFVNGKFRIAINSTIGSDFVQKIIQFEGKKIKLQIWDTAGHQSYRTVVLSHFRRAHGIIIVYDVTNQKSFDSVKKWIEEIDQHAPKNVNRLLVGNKCDDKTTKRDVDYKTAKKFADQLGIPFFETSAKNDTNVEEAFVTMVAEIKKRLFPPTSVADASQQEGIIKLSTPVKTQTNEAVADKKNEDSRPGSCSNVEDQDMETAAKKGMEAVADKQNENTLAGNSSNLKRQDVKIANESMEAVTKKQNEDTLPGSSGNVKWPAVKKANESMEAVTKKQNEDTPPGSSSNVKCPAVKIANESMEAVTKKQNEDTLPGSSGNVKCPVVKSAAVKPPSSNNSVSAWSRMLTSIASLFRRQDKDHELIVDEAMEAVAEKQNEDTPSGSCSSVECQNMKSFQKLILNFKELFITGKYSDFTIKVKGREFKVHRAILAAHSSVFDTMFSHDLSESNGVFPIEDCEPAVFEEFLYFVYAGKTKHLCSDNVCELFYLADKYDLAELKQECITFLKKSLSIETICDVIWLSAKHNETELLEISKEFFTRNLEKVLVTPKWQLFLKEHPTEANELIIKAHKSGYTQKNA